MVERPDWDLAQQRGSHQPESLAAEGFIHCTVGERNLVEVANRHYRGVPGEWLVLVLDPARVSSEIRWEVQADALAYPHVYGPLNLDAVVDVVPFPRSETGEFLAFRRDDGSGVEEAERLESLELFAGGIAHDFNNLLVGIIGNAAMAMDELPANSKARELVRDIAVGGQRCAEMAQEMLVHSGGGQVEVGEIDLNGLIREMARLLRLSLGKGVEIRFQLAEALPRIEGDATEIRQAVMNLILNASDAIGDSAGTITISTSVVSASPEMLTQVYGASDLPAGDYVCLEVADTGAGMPGGVQEHIFEPFFTTKSSGRGLGLAVVDGVARAHGGTVHVNSEAGRGSTFTVLLPTTESSGRLEGAGHEEAWRGSGTVLIVDDDEVVRGVAGRILERAGFDVLSAADGQQALRLFGEHGADLALVLLDLTMPGMSGGQVLQELRSLERTVPVALMSGHPEKEARKQPGLAAAEGFVAKPFTAQSLRSVVRRTIEGAGAGG